MAFCAGKVGRNEQLADRLAAELRDRANVVSTTDAIPSTGDRKKAKPADAFRDLKAKVHNRLLQQLGPKLYDADLTQSELERMVRGALQDAMTDEDMLLTPADRTRIAQEIADDILGYGPIEPFLRDPDLTEVMVNGPDDIWIERSGRLQKVDGRFNDEAHLRRTIDKIVSRIGRRVDESSPMVDARLPDGTRVNAVIPPLAIDGSLLTIRKFSADPYTSDDLVAFGTLLAAHRRLPVGMRPRQAEHHRVGQHRRRQDDHASTCSPRSSRATSASSPSRTRPSSSCTRTTCSASSPARPNIEGKGAVDIRDLVRNSLRMRPDRIVVGEVRDAAALDMLQAMNTGHDGSICTVHSNGPRDTLARIETMVLMAGMDLPIRAIREQVASAVDLIVHQSRLRTVRAASPTSPRSSGWRVT